MTLTLPDLPYPRDALEPHMTAETLDYHYGRHHKAYVDNANKLLPGSGLEHLPLEEMVRRAEGKLFNNVAQVWNHTFFWNCLSGRPGKPGKALSDALDRHFGGLDGFRRQFTEAATGVFGSGWTWLVKKADGSLAIASTANADTPLTGPDKPLLTCDVWEHAYYIDYRNARPTYLEHYWSIVNWQFVEQNLG